MGLQNVFLHGCELKFLLYFFKTLDLEWTGGKKTHCSSTTCCLRITDLDNTGAILKPTIGPIKGRKGTMSTASSAR